MNLREWRGIASPKHGRLHEWARTIKCLAPAIPGRLNDKMDMHRLPARMRPGADVYLLRVANSLHGPRYALQERTDLLGFRWGKIAEMQAMTEWLDDQCPHAQRSRAVLNDPMRRGVDPAAGERFSALSKPTRIAI